MIKIASSAETLSFFQKEYTNRKTKIQGFYNSHFNKLIVDEKLMLLPIEDRLSIRGHGAFDMVYVKNKHFISMDVHLDRLQLSSATVDIIPPMEKQKLAQTLKQIMKAVFKKYLQENGPDAENKLQKQVFGLRLAMSSGFDDFGISSIGKKSGLYVYVFSVLSPQSNLRKRRKRLRSQNCQGFKLDCSCKDHQLLVKCHDGQRIKRVKGVISEQRPSSIANVAFIFGKQFATPRLETVIKGVTLLRIIKYIEKLKQEGIIQKISFRDITIQEAEKSEEMMILGGEKIVPVLQFNDKLISKEKGKVTSMIQAWYRDENHQLTPILS